MRASPLADPPFRRLLAVFLRQRHRQRHPGHAGAVLRPDRLQAPPRCEPLFLGSYFVGARAVACRCGCGGVRASAWRAAWLAGMVLAVGGFVWAAALGAGDVPARSLVVLRPVGRGAGRRPGAARRAAGRRDRRAGDRGPGRRRLLRLVELRHQAQPGAGRRAGAAAAGRCSATRRARRDAAGAAGADAGLLRAALRAEAAGRGALACDPACDAARPDRIDPHETTTSSRRRGRRAALALAGCAGAAASATTRPKSRCWTCATTSTARWTPTACSPTARARSCKRFTVVDDGHLDRATTACSTRTSPTPTARRKSASGA